MQGRAAVQAVSRWPGAFRDARTGRRLLRGEAQAMARGAFQDGRGVAAAVTPAELVLAIGEGSAAALEAAARRPRLFGVVAGDAKTPFDSLAGFVALPPLPPCTGAPPAE